MAEGRNDCSVSNVKEEDDITACPICFEKFTKPKYLPCLHTFCEGCLQSYITKSTEDCKTSAGFKCPLCRRVVPAPGSLEDSSRWAAALPVNNFMSTLKDRQTLKSGVKWCQACQRENESETATTWCEVCMEALCDMCVKYHRRNLATKLHQLQPIENVQFDEFPIQGDITNCKEHNNCLEFFCTDHDAPCCITCVTLLHRKCETVDTMEKTAALFCDSSMLDALLSELATNQEMTEKIIQELDSNINSLSRDADKVSDDIEKFIDDMNHLLSQLKERSLAEVAQVKKLHTEKSKQTKEEFENLNSLLKNYHTIMTMSRKHGSNTQVMLEYKRIKSLQKELWKCLVHSSYSVKILHMTLDINDELVQHKKALEKIKTMKIEANQMPTQTRFQDLMTLSPVLLKEFKSPENALIKGALFLEDDRLLLSGRNRPYCFLTDGNDQVLQKITLEKSPFNMDFLNPNQVVISFESQNVLQKINTTDMKLGEKINLSFPGRGVSCRGNFAYVASASHIRRVDLQGHTEDTITADCIDPWHVKAKDDDTVLYANHSGHTVHSISGSVQNFQYQNDKLSYPFGLGVDRQGNAYICGYSSNNVHQVSADGQKHRIILTETDGISSPTCLEFKPNSDIFLVYSYGNGNVKLYEMR